MSKIKLVPCPAITKREINNALMAGRKFCINDERVKHLVIHWDDNHGHSPVRQGLDRWNWRGFKYLCELVEQQWYEDPDMIGKPVKVRDHKDSAWIITLFIGHYGSAIHRFKCDFNSFKYAEPLTAADLYQEQV